MIASKRQLKVPAARVALLIMSMSTSLGMSASACAPRGNPESAPPVTSAPLPGVTKGALVPTAMEARLPPAPGAFAPTFARFDIIGDTSPDLLGDVDSCAACHPDVAAHWRTSAHALASFNNPVYRMATHRLREEVGAEAVRLCAGCHDPVLLVKGDIDAGVRADDPNIHVGVSCRVCHGIAEAGPEGNGSYTLRIGKIPVPIAGDAESVRTHVTAVTPAPLRSGALCATCHRAFLGDTTGNPHHLPGMDDATAWSRSGYAGSKASRVDEPVEPSACRECHMAPEGASSMEMAATDGMIASHRFLGGHTWLRAMLLDADGVERSRRFLEGVARIDVAAVRHADGSMTVPADGAALTPGERVVLDVVIRNLGVGHRFPGGTLDAQDTWIEVEVRDAAGGLVAEAGGRHAADGDDETAHRLVAVMVDDKGWPVEIRETHRFRAKVYDHTLAPRDAAVISYGLTLPELSPDRLPLEVRARLRHRSRPMLLVSSSCKESKTPGGRAFTDAVSARRDFDPCALPPVAEVAEARVWIGGPPPEGATRSDVPTWRRLFDHGLGLLHAVQERAHEARPSLEGALALLEAEAGTAHERAIVLSLLGRLSGREGRTDEAMAFFDDAEALAPGHPAIDRARGDALAAVWRWESAAEALGRAAAATPRDDATWSRLAVALGAAGLPEAALGAAHHGLGYTPHGADLLRVQALALRSLDAPAPVVEAAFAHWLERRPPDDAKALRLTCMRESARCALEAEPVHVHEMRMAPGR